MQFFSIDHHGLADFATFYEALALQPARKVPAVCKLLDIQPKTLNGYLTGKKNPPPAFVRLLFHECYYGRAATDSHAHSGHMYALALSKSLQSENDKLRAMLQALELENQELKTSSTPAGRMAANSSRWRA